MESKVHVDHQYAPATRSYVVRALVELRGSPVAAGRGRLPLNLSLVLDRSGSMSGDKLRAARDAATLLVRRLDPADVVSVVAYDDHVRTVVPPATGDERGGVVGRIREIATGGSTNLSGGWLRGRELVAGRQLTEGVNRVLLLTDGLANVGITDPERLTGLCRQARERGVTTTTIGFGADYNEHLLQAMADAGGGHTYYIERPDQAGGIFEEELEGLVGLAAQNVTIEVRPTGGAQLTAVHHGYPRTAVADGVRLEVGDLFSREPRRLLLEFEVPAGAEEGILRRIAKVRVGAAVLTEEGGVEQREIRFPIEVALTREGRHGPEVRRELLLTEAARARENALAARRTGRFDVGRSSLRQTADRIRNLADPADGALQEEARDLLAMADLYARSSVSDADAKYLNQRVYDTSRSKRAATGRIARGPGYGFGPAAGVPVRYVTGDVTRPMGPGRKLVVHVADDAGGWGHGNGSVIAGRWPEARTRYVGWAAGELQEANAFSLGAMQVVEVEPTIAVATLIACHLNGTLGAPTLHYGALDEALARLGDIALHAGVSVHMSRLGPGDPAGDWLLIEPMIHQRLSARGVPVTVYQRPEPVDVR